MTTLDGFAATFYHLATDLLAAAQLGRRHLLRMLFSTDPTLYVDVRVPGTFLKVLFPLWILGLHHGELELGLSFRTDWLAVSHS